MTLMRASATVAELGERAIVARITSRLLQPAWVVVGPGDDAAVVEPVARRLEVLTTDALVEGVHFDRRFTPPDAIGHRALAVNLSDLAAMGARPRTALLSLILPGGLPVADLDDIVTGLTRLADQERVAIVGGNITSSPGPLIVDVTATGYVHPRRLLTRAGARPGDEIFVTGSLGAAAAGLRSMQREANLSTADRGTSIEPSMQAARERYLRPSPRVRAGTMLADHKAASACIDLSDGLADGVRRIAEASGVGATLHEEAIPIDPAVSMWHGGDVAHEIDTVLRAGDDYELLFTSPPRARGRLRGVRRLISGLAITRIGVVTKGREVCVRAASGTRPLPDGFAHFG